MFEAQLMGRVMRLEAELSQMRARVETLARALQAAGTQPRTAPAAFARPTSLARREAARAGGIARAASAVRFADGTFAAYADEADDGG